MFVLRFLPLTTTENFGPKISQNPFHGIVSTQKSVCFSVCLSVYLFICLAAAFCQDLKSRFFVKLCQILEILSNIFHVSSFLLGSVIASEGIKGNRPFLMITQPLKMIKKLCYLVYFELEFTSELPFIGVRYCQWGNGGS